MILVPVNMPHFDFSPCNFFVFFCPCKYVSFWFFVLGPTFMMICTRGTWWLNPFIRKI